jgi:hypothetical protein
MNIFKKIFGKNAKSSMKSSIKKPNSCCNVKIEEVKKEDK